MTDDQKLMLYKDSAMTVPKHILVYEFTPEESLSYYTTVFIGNYNRPEQDKVAYTKHKTTYGGTKLTIESEHNEMTEAADITEYQNLFGFRIEFEDLPKDLQILIRMEYSSLWLT